MKRVTALSLIALLVALTSVSSVLAAEAEYGVGGGGPGIGLFLPDLTEINAFVSGAGFSPFEGNLFLIGGGGQGGLIPGPSYGGSGWGAWIESRDGDLYAEYGLGLGGFEMGYAVGGDENSLLALGLTIGGGGAELILTEYPPIHPYSVDPRGIVPEPTRFTYDSVFFFAAPYADVRIQLLSWMGLGLRAGYVWAPIEFNASDDGPLEAPRLAPSGIYVQFSVVFGGIGEIGDATDDDL